MGQTLFTHKGCGGTLMVDCMSIFIIKSPSLSVTSVGVKIGVMEIQDRPGADIHLNLVCQKCGTSVNIPDEAEAILFECCFCHKKKPALEINVSREYPGYCSSCESILSGDKKPPEGLERVFSYLSAPARGTVKPLLKILSEKPLY